MAQCSPDKDGKSRVGYILVSPVSVPWIDDSFVDRRYCLLAEHKEMNERFQREAQYMEARVLLAIRQVLDGHAFPKFHSSVCFMSLVYIR